MDEVYYPADRNHVPFPRIFATWRGVGTAEPDPCLKYHMSAALGSAAGVAVVVLPMLRARRLHHKVVQSRARYARMQTGEQAGKLITVYAPTSIDHARLEAIEAVLAPHPDVEPSPTLPRSRALRHVFAEQPWGARMFLYGGYRNDPTP